MTTFSEKLSLRGRHALVCGASRGIGRACAEALAAMGCRLSLLARSEDKLQRLLPDLERLGAAGVSVLPLDLAETASLTEALESHLRASGDIHILVHNTGGPPPGAVLEATPEDFESAIGRHLLSAQLLLQGLLPGMRKAEFGRIVNVLSTSVREPIANLGVSNVARAAMAAWAKSVANELPPGLTINNVLPGFTGTERLDELADHLASKSKRSREQVFQDWKKLVPEQRIGEPWEIAAAVAFLCSPAAGFIRGASLAVDGGRLRGI